jgi:hypothetical protein
MLLRRCGVQAGGWLCCWLLRGVGELLRGGWIYLEGWTGVRRWFGVYGIHGFIWCGCGMEEVWFEGGCRMEKILCWNREGNSRAAACPCPFSP